jgi:hypothetical protein
MDAPKSKLGDRIYSKYKNKILEKMKNGVLIGEIFEIDGKKYKVTDGEIDFNEIDKIKERMNKIIKEK